jgi:three-Cys-motif partner protein
MGQTKNFFKEKKHWSLIKDRILDYYLTPYIAKIITTGKPLIIFDCFAGKGKFDSGENGSPLIIAEKIKTVIQKYPTLSDRVKGVFIEKKYFPDLKTNLAGHPNTEVLAGTFEDNLGNILSAHTLSSVFFYIDPYGIKSLSLSNFKQIKDKNFSSNEMLMNFNSAGFLREGCRLLNSDDLLKDIEIDDYEMDDAANNVEKMDAVAGGTYWQDILNDFYNGKFDIYQAEDKFISEYSSKLKDIYLYTVNIPIKLKSSHLPKYRLIFGSNNEGGVILMADNMNKKWKEIVDQQRNGQLALLEFEFPDLSLLRGFDLKKDIMSFVSAHSSGIPLKSLIVALIQKYGITFSESYYNGTIKQMEKDSDLVIIRNPPITKKTGKPATSMDYDEYEILIRRRC